MRDHYAGDLSDLIKFSFLRSLAGNNRSLGIAWYYAPTLDNKRDGKHLDWKDEDRWSSLDVNVRSELSELTERKVSVLQACSFWPSSTSFHSAPILTGTERASWTSKKRAKIGDSDIVFLDPDNGLNQDATVKHATYEEVRHFVASGKCVVFITFPKRMNHNNQVQQLHADLVERTGAQHIWTMRVAVSIRNRQKSGYVPTFRRFTVINPDLEIERRANHFTELLNQVNKVRARNDEYSSS